MMLRRLFERRPAPGQVLYEAIVAAARQPFLYEDHAVPDTVDGRFDMIALHMFLVLDRLEGEEFRSLRQSTTDAFFLDMDRSLREMGAGDLSIAKKVRKMAEAYYGRIQAYATAVKDGEAPLAAALARNVFPDTPAVDASGLARYVIAARGRLALQAAEDIAAARMFLT